MNKGIAIKAGIILGFFAVVLGLAFGCSSIKDNDVTPQIENGGDVFLTVGDIEITNQALWNDMKITDGLTYLNQLVEEMLLDEYIDLVTQDLIDAKVEEAIYGSNDQDAIAKIREDADLEDELQLVYERTMVLQGLDPTDPADVRSYFELTIAKELYTRDFIEAIEDETNSLYISDDDVRNHYADTVRGDVCALVVRFHSYDESEAIFKAQNIVTNYEDRLGKYVGTTPIDQVPTADFDETNTNVMTDDDALEAFIDLYNYQYEATLDNTTDLADFCDTYGDDFTYNWEDLTGRFDSTNAEGTFAAYLWDTLELIDDDETDEEIPLRFSSTPRSIDEYELMVYKISEEEVTAFEDLTQAEQDALYEEVLEASITSTSVNTAMTDLRANHDFEILDPLFKLQYEFSSGETFDNNGDDRLVATLDNTDISAQDLFEYMVQSIGSYYAIEMVKQNAVLYSDFYTDLYGDDYDYLENDSDKMVEHRAELRNMKSIFSNNGYAQYGFSSSEFTWDEFIILAFGSMSEANVLRDIFVLASIQPNLVKDLVAYENAAEFIQAQVDEYFSLNATHLLLYLDNDMNFQPDEYNDFVDGLSGGDLTEYTSLIVSFESLVKSKINNDDYTMDDIVDEFRNGLVGDSENEWAEFKAYGFFVLTENLTPQQSLTNNNSGNYDQDFVAGMKRIYDDYVVAEENDSTLSRYVDDQLTQSNFGMHFIIATEGTGFNQPTAEFDVTDTSYEAGFANDSMVPNEAQFDLYLEVKFADLVDGTVDYTVPSSVRSAFGAYYDTIFDSYFSASGYTIAAAEYMLANNPVFGSLLSDQEAFLQTVVDVLYEVAFPEEFLTPAELSE